MLDTIAPVTLSERAARRIARILSAEPGGTALRISVSGGGCSGFQYGFDLDQTRAPGLACAVEMAARATSPLIIR